MTDAQAFMLFRELRWGAGEEAGCPKLRQFCKTAENQRPDKRCAFVMHQRVGNGRE